MFHLTHFEPEKYTFIDTGYKQVIVDDIKKLPFWSNWATKIWIWSSEGEIKKSYAMIIKKQKKREMNFWISFFDYAVLYLTM